MTKNGKYYGLLHGAYKLENCKRTANKYNNDKSLDERGFKYFITDKMKYP